MALRKKMKFPYIIFVKKMNELPYGGLIETMYAQFPLEEIPENIKEYKELINGLFSSTSQNELDKKLSKFSENEKNYLGCTILDDFFKIYNKDDPLGEAIKLNINERIIELYMNFSGFYDIEFIPIEILSQKDEFYFPKDEFQYIRT